MSEPKKAIPPESSDGLFLSKPWREHTPEEREALYPLVQREADRKRLLDSHGQWVDSVLKRPGTELIWIDVKCDSSEVAKIRRPAKLSFIEAIPELKLVDACPEVVEYVGTKGERLRLLVADPLSIEELESFASGTRLPSERRANRAQTVETAERAKARSEKELKGAKKGGDNRSAPMAERLEAAADAWWKRDPTLKLCEVAHKLERGEKANGRNVRPGVFGGYEAIRKKIKKPISG